MQTWYEVWKTGNKITQVQVSRATDKAVFVVDAKGNEQRNAIESKYTNYFPTLVAAVGYLRGRFEANIVNYRRYIEQAQGNLAKLEQEYPAEYAAAQQQQEAA